MQRTKWLKSVGLFVAILTAFATANWGQEPDQTQITPTPKKAIPLSQHHNKISDRLMTLTQAAPGALPQFAQGGNSGAVNAQGIRVIIEPNGSASVLPDATLQGLGVWVEARSRSLIRARVPASKLVALAELGAVRYLRKPYQFQALQRVDYNQAITPIGATFLHTMGGLGQGVKVAVIDVGFQSINFAEIKGVWPSEQIMDIHDYSDVEDTGHHGTIVTLIVNEVAPQVDLYLKRVYDAVDLENAVDDAIRQGVDIINHSVGWTNSNFSDGTGFFSELVSRAQNAGILWVNAVGNHAESHWAGQYIDQNNNGWMDFPGGEDEALRFVVGLPDNYGINLTWDDWPLSNQDLDLYIFDREGNEVASATNWQTGNQPPEESLEFFALERGAYFIKVFGRNVTKPFRIKLFGGGSPIIPSIPHGSVLAPADAADSLSVGAISIFDWADGGPQESFSSLGPTSDGRIKPDLVAPDNVYNVVQVGRFQGTSASAPHVAGAAALLLSLNPSWNVHQLKQALLSYTIDAGYPGKDPVYGEGLLDLAAPQIEFERALSQTTIEPGATIEVSVQARVPALVFGAIELTEHLPAGWRIQSTDTNFNPATRTWFWSGVRPGDVLVASYIMIVPNDQTEGEIELSGSVNGATIGGQSTITVVRPAQPVKLQQPSAHNEPALKVQRTALGLAITPLSEHIGFSLLVYDLGGNMVFESHTQARTLRWNGLAQNGGTAANGVYLVVVHIPGRSTVTTPVVWLR